MKKLLFTFLIIGASYYINAQPDWTPASESNVSQNVWAGRKKPDNFKVFKLNQKAIEAKLANAPSEKNSRSGSLIIELPGLDGKLHQFRVVTAPVVAPGLLEKMKIGQSYSGVSVDDPYTTVRFSVTQFGFNALIYSVEKETVYIRGLDAKNGLHIVFTDPEGLHEDFKCTTKEAAKALQKSAKLTEAAQLNANDGQIRIYRLALAASGEFSQAYDDDPENDDPDATRKAAVIAFQTIRLTDANSYLERDFGIRLEIIADNDKVIYLDPDTDPWDSSDDDGNYNSTTQTAIDAQITSANYDIGHLMRLSVAGSNLGNAGGIGTVGNNASKGSGFTSRSGWDSLDGYSGMMFTHEIGHQCGANHTFGHKDDNDNAQMEPGSGSTFMSYGGNGIAPAEETIELRSKYFHAISIQQATDYLAGAGVGTTQAAGNTAPSVNAGSDFTIPKSTPFVLKGSASDSESDALTYTWEQMDKLTDGPWPHLPTSTHTYGPEFRSRPPVTSLNRVMPEGGVNNTWEVLPSVARTLKFRFTVRDSHVGGMQNNSDDMVVTIDGDAGPFQVTAPNGGEDYCPGDYNITWNVNGSDELASNVKILLSTNGGVNYSEIVASTPNDGSYTYNFPCTYSNQARIKIEAIGNIFFDEGDGNFTFGDNQNPTFTTPGPVTIYKDENCEYDAAPSITGEPTNVNDNCDNTPTVSHSDVVSAGSCVGETVITRTWKVEDNCGKSTTQNQTITIKDEIAPTFTVPIDAIIAKDENCEYDADPSITGSPSNVDDNCDPDPDVTYSDVVIAGSCMGEEIITRTWKVTDDCGNEATDTQTITAKDTTPPEFSDVSASPNNLWPPNHKMKEVKINYTVTDNCSDAEHITTTLEIVSNEPVNGTGDGDTEPIDFEVIDNHTVMLRAERAGNGDGRIYTITITSVDDCGNSSSTQTEVYVAHNITAPLAGEAFKAGSTVKFNGTFQDMAGRNHKVKWIIDDVTSVNGIITSEPAGRKNGTATGSYRFKDPGVYKLRMEITDQFGNMSYASTAGDQEATVVIYDPAAGNAFGGGWFASPAGALNSNPSAIGKASFGFEVHYFKKATLPKGETRFEIKVGEFEFTALNFDYLAISDNRAQMMGTGKITGGQSGINYILTVIDNGDATDYIRFKIYNKNTNEVYYDNQPGASDAASPSTPASAQSVITVIRYEKSALVQQDPESEIILDFNISAYPNPSNHEFNLQINSTDETTPVSIKVMNIDGKVFEQRIINDSSNLQLGKNWNPGFYILEVLQGKSRKTVKLVKM